MAETLYEKDYVAWLQDQIEKMRSPDRNTLDWQTLAEELEEMVDERKYKAESFLFLFNSSVTCYFTPTGIILTTYPTGQTR
ncbi:DUF29 family protein [Microcystis sp.]|uniref:DUF29 family protein n=1 Tax=Microcystis sp. TaxID=1127 RepID=UPI003AF6EC73